MTKFMKILSVLRRGPTTSGEIAKAIGGDRRGVSVALCRLAELGLIERAGVVNDARVGRPYVRWKLRERGSSDATVAFLKAFPASSGFETDELAEADLRLSDNNSGHSSK
jgi:predicted ArsR family transcriptional regulator